MKKTLLTLVITLVSFSLFAQIPSGYYDDAQGHSGESLKTELYYIIKDHNSQSYGALWDHYYTTDDKPNGKVWDMYSDVPGGNPPYEFTFGSGQCGNYSGEGDCYNREHSFPKSWFDDSSPMVTDIFHIVPTDGYVNGKRSNWPFGETNSPSWTSDNGSKVGSCSVSGYNGTIFEPIDAYKGDFARIYFYMATRYENRIASWENNSSNSDAALDGSSFPCYEEWYLNMLLDWHNNDPVSQKEIDRNNDIYYEVQGNRNPFVDHPEWVALVWGGVQAPSITNVSYTPQFPEENEAVTVSAQITDDGGIVTSQLLWGLASSNLNNTVNLSASGNNYSATIPGQSAGQQVYFRIKAIDDDNNTSLSSVNNYQVAENAGFISLPFTEDFNDETLGIFLDVSVTGPELTWHNDDYQDAYYAKMSNYNGTDNSENEDWLITPGINFDGYSNEKLNFKSSMKDYDDDNCFIYLMYSTNYSGTGNPNNATWTDISSSANWSNGDYTWTESGEINLASITGNQVYLAFKYDSQAGSGKTWQIDDVSITIDGTSNTPPQITDVSHSPNTPDANEAVIVSATITDDGSVASAELLWGLSSSSLNNTVNLTASGSSYSGQISGQTESTTVYYQIKATDNDAEVGTSTIASYTVNGSSGTPPQISDIEHLPVIPNDNEPVIVTANITDDGSISSSELLWGYSSTNLNNMINLSASGNNYSATIPGQSAGQQVYFKIKAIDDENNTSLSSVYNYQVAENAGFISLPFTEDFNDETLGIFHDVNVTGPELTWHNDDYQDAYYAKMSNYNGTDNSENEDWLITPAINFDNYTNEKLNFKSSMKDYDDDNCFIYLMYSTNYSGTGDPNNATWTDISSAANWSGGDYTWTESGEITLESITGNQVYLAFKYDSQAGSGKTWQIDDVSITIDGTSNTPPQITNVSHNPNIPDANEAVVVSATITDDGSVASAELLWGYSSSNLNNTVNMTASGSSYSGQIPGQTESTTVYYKIKATDNEAAVGTSTVTSYTVAAASNTPPVITNVEHNPNLPAINEAVIVSATITDDENIASAEVFWGFTSTSLSNQVTMSGTGNNYTGQIPGQTEGQIVYYKVKATDNESATSESSIMNYTVESATNNPPQINNLSHSPNAPDEAEAVIISCDIIDDNAVAQAIIFYGLSSSSMTSQITMTNSGDNYTGTIPGQNENVTIYYQVKAIDDEDAFSLSVTQNFTVNETENIPPVINTVTYDPSNPVEAEEVTVTANITDDEAIESALVLWGISETSMSNIVNMSASGDNYSAIIPGQNEGVTIYFKVQAFDNDSDMTESSTYQYYIEITTNELTLPFTEDFENEDLGVFNEYSVSGDENTWHNDDYQDSFYAKMSNYNGTENIENEDWLITRSINFDNYSNETLNFNSSMKNFDDNSTFIYIKYSNNYDGTSNPNNATWTDLSALASWSTGDYEWVESGDIDISDINGTEVYLAFQYVSEDGSGKTWQIDNVSVTLGASNTPPVISNIIQSPEEPYQTNEVDITAQITDDGSIEIAEIQYGLSPTEMDQVSNLSGSSSNYSGAIPALDAGQTIYYRIMAEDNDGAISYSSIYNYYIDLYDGIQTINQVDWTVYPNPANQVIKVISSFEKNVNLMIYHSSGQLVFETQSYILNSNIDVSNFAPGMYYIRVNDNDQSESLPLIIR